jgi:hypothetical protein
LRASGNVVESSPEHPLEVEITKESRRFYPDPKKFTWMLTLKHIQPSKFAFFQ